MRVSLPEQDLNIITQPTQPDTRVSETPTTNNNIEPIIQVQQQLTRVQEQQKDNIESKHNKAPLRMQLQSIMQAHRKKHNNNLVQHIKNNNNLINHVTCPLTGNILNYQKLLKTDMKSVWIEKMCNEFG